MSQINSLEYLHRMLLERGHEDLVFHVEQVIQQRDRLLYGVNARTSELHTMKQELELLRERYRLMVLKHSQLSEIGQQLQEEIRKLKNEHS